jgi:hypothetical protein
MPQENPMVRVAHSRWQGSLVVVLALGLGTACKKDDSKKSGDQPAGDKASGPAASRTGDDLSLLPVDSEVVLGINFAQIQGSPLWQQFVAPKMMSPDTQARLKEFKDACGLDPMTAVKSVSVGMKMSGAQQEATIVVHGVDKAKAWACLDNPKIKAEMAKEGGTFTRDGEVGLFKDPKGQQMAMTFVNDSTAILVVGEAVTAATAKAAAAGGSALKTSASFTEMYNKVKTTDTLWFFVNGGSALLDKIPGAKPRALFGSVNVSDGLSVDLRARFDSPGAASELAKTLSTQVKQARDAGMVDVDKAEVTAEGSDLKVDAVVSSAKLKELMNKFGGLAGMGQ